ncbi:MAG: hypothetical protein ACR2PA_18380 [Hyphomicrobiaceae bacterium]
MMINPLEPIKVSPEVLDRWHMAARDLRVHGVGLRFELGRICAGQKHRYVFGRAAKAARIAENATEGELSRLAATVAAEIEEAAQE